MKNKRGLILGIAFLLIFLSANSVITQENNRAIIDPKIEELLQKQEEVFVIVTLKDSSTSIIYTEKNRIKERIKILQQKDQINEREVSRILLSLNTDLKIVGKSPRSFSGNITRNGLDILKSNPNVIRIYHSLPGKISLQQSLPLINATNVWSSSYTGKNQTICIIDSGVNYTHSDLGNCTHTNNINDGSYQKVIGGYDFYNNDNNPMDDNGHGTYVAGIAVANGKINGTAPNAKIIAIKVTNSSGEFQDDSGIAAGVRWCTGNSSIYNISIITISLSTFSLYDNSSICDSFDAGIAINEAHAAGIFVDVSSGNNGNLTHITHPACTSNATSVGAIYDEDIGSQTWCLNSQCTQTCTDSTTQKDKMWCANNRGDLLDLLAPGCKINSTNIDGGYEWGSQCGTSYAAPHVAGGAALLLEKDNTLNPSDIKNLLKDTGIKIDNWSRIDLLAAINITLIRNCSQLQKIKDDLSGNYRLVKNIDCSETINWNNGAGFEPIGPLVNNAFTGVLDGQNHTVTGLYINRSTTSDVGLFGVSLGKIKNMGLINASIIGQFGVGALAGDHVGTDSGAGGRIIENVFCTGGNVSGKQTVGGLVGGNTADINNSYSNCNINGELGRTGGLVGSNGGWGRITNSYATGNINGSNRIGGLVGNNDGVIVRLLILFLREI